MPKVKSEKTWRGREEKEREKKLKLLMSSCAWARREINSLSTFIKRVKFSFAWAKQKKGANYPITPPPPPPLDPKELMSGKTFTF
jgi:hypothetical protein